MAQVTAPTHARAEAEPVITAARWAGSLLAVTAIVSVVSSVLGVVVVPGLRGNAAEHTVVLWERVSATAAYVTMGLVVALVCGASFEVARSARIHVAHRVASVGCAGLALALASQGLVMRLQPIAALALLAAGAVGVGSSGLACLSSIHTRAAGAALLVVALSAMCRGAAWEIAGYAGEHSNTGLYAVSRGVVTAAVVFEGATQILVVTWLTVRGSWRARVLAYGSVVLAFAATIAAARAEAGPTAGGILRAALVDAQAHPLPYGLAPAAVFFLPASLCIAAAALGSGTRVAPVATVLALLVASHARFDVPIPALMAVAAGMWLTLIAAAPRD